jgi:hypothetical protein
VSTDDPGEDYEEILWNCGCGLLVDGSEQCPSCGSWAPWISGSDHDDEDEGFDDFDYDPEADIP